MTDFTDPIIFEIFLSKNKIDMIDALHKLNFKMLTDMEFPHHEHNEKIEKINQLRKRIREFTSEFVRDIWRA